MIQLAVINVTLSGGADQITATPIYSSWFAVQLSLGATGTVVYLGDSGLTGDTDAMFEGGKGQVVSVIPSGKRDMVDADVFDLSHYYLLGTANDICHICYEIAVAP